MKVRFYIDNIWEVVNEEGDSLYQGLLSDCEAFIRLTEGGYL